MKKTTLLKTMLLLCALIVGSSYGWAQTDKSAVHTSNVTLPTSGTNVSSCTVVIGGSDYDGTKLGKGGTGASASITAPSGTKYIHLHVAAWKDKSPGFTYKVGTADAVSISGINSDSGIANSSPFTFSGDATSSNYYKVITLATALENNTTITFESTSERVVFWGVNTEAESSTFNVTYNANGATSGTVPTDATDYEKNATVTVAGNTGSLVKTHYTFDGWNTKADGTGTDRAVGSTFNITANTTLYAKWTPNTHNITMPTTDTYGTYTASATSEVPYGTGITLTYTPASGYESYVATWSVNGTPISGNTFDMPDENVVVTVDVNLDPHIYTTLGGTEMAAMSNAGTTYGNVKTIIKDGLTWTADAYQDEAKTDNKMLQLRKRDHSSGVSYIKLPVFSGNIQNITFSVTSTSSDTEAGDETSVTLQFQADNSKTGTVIASSGSTASSEKVIDLSSLGNDYNTGYITVKTGDYGIRIWSITVAYLPTDIDVSVSSANYATFCDHLNRNFDGTGITVYKAASNGTKVTLTEITDGIVPANTGVVLYKDGGTAGNVAIPVAASAGSGNYTGNEMVGINVTTKVAADGGSSKTNYILSNEASGVGFYKATDSGANLGAHKAYLSTTNAASARDFLGFEENTTAIESITNSKEIKGEYFNLAGQRVAQPTKGLYIVNGKKVVIK